MSVQRTARIPLELPSSEHCAGCVHALREAVEALPGVRTVELDARGPAVTVTYDPGTVSEESLRRETELLGMRIGSERGHVVFKLTGLDCPDCARTVDKSVSRVDGVLSADLVFASGLMVVEYESGSDPTDEVVSMVLSMGYGIELVEQAAGRRTAEFRLLGLDCPDCAAKLQASLGAAPGVHDAVADFGAARLRVVYDPARTGPEPLAEAVRAAGYDVEAEAPSEEERPGWPASHRQEITVAVGAALVAAGWLLSWSGAPEGAVVAAYAGAIAVAGARIARRALASVRARSLDMNVLMTVAVAGAAAIGEWNEGAAVVVLFAVGSLLESRALARTRASIRALMDLAPPKARVRRDGGEFEVAPAEAAVGDVLLVRPGERIALDGRVAGGFSAVDESPITGESVPVDKAIGDEVFAGTLNTSGRLEVLVTAEAADSTIARVVYMVEEAQAQRAPSQRLVDRFTRYYTPAVVGLAVAIAAVPPLAGPALGFPAPFSEWFRRALVMLVVSCPCALVISTPVAIVSAITRATRDGVLVKGGLFLETAPRVRAVAIDKTGTLTRGAPQVSDVVPLDGPPPSEILGTAAALEAHSTHPLAAAVVRAAGGGDGEGVTEFADVPGRGVRAVLGGKRYALGNRALAEEEGALDRAAAEAVGRLEDEGRTVLVLASEGRALGLIGLADEVRPEAPDVVARLRAGGVEHVVMLTGDNERTAGGVARHAGVAEFRARLLPEDKVTAVRELKERYGTVAMVGDGVNDAPALAVSDIGVAMGAKGSDTALETADVALMREGLGPLPGFLALGRRTVANIAQNVAVSIAVKLAVLVLAVLGIATLWMAVFADTGVSLLVTLNGLRLLRARPRGT